MNITFEGDLMNKRENKPEDTSPSSNKMKGEELQDSTARIRRLSDYNKS